MKESMSNPESPTPNDGVQSLYSGVDHQASWERSYNADGRVYSSAPQIRQDWREFLQESQNQERRRAVMRCYISRDLLDQITDLPIEAAVPIGNEYLLWIGHNQHPGVSILRNVREVPPPRLMQLPSEYQLDTQVRDSDVNHLIELWGQFGWTPDAVRNFVRNHANGNPVALIRTMEEEAIGVMIAESVEFGAHRLVEMTELAVHPSYRGHHLASTLIRELSRLSVERWEHALVFGEYNLTTRSYQSAARAGQIAGQTAHVDGVLRDHVGIETGRGNEVADSPSTWNTRWLHNFLVMYQPNRKIQHKV
jgi:ribosomal protein S18 acetylase RimI-like enzyme